MKSAGIDPSTGRELFYDKEGNYTYDFSYDNEVICGNTRPKIEGVIGTSLNYKGFSVSMNFRYQTGASVFNEALFNTLYGSDPNRLPNMEIRGKSSMLGMRDELEADPNQPLFILDGFESSLSVINDMDINRIASITILKDAASTAIYGSKAANGVVVVETVKPQAGKLMVSYNGNANISMPDLSSYNLMNAKEKLAFEKLAGKYTPASWSATSEFELQKLYNQKLAEIESGIDTYWLTEPLRVGVNQKHSLYIEGGEGSFLFGIGAGYNGISGVMEKSNREVISGNIDLIYRIKKFQFSNKFSMTNTKIKNPIVAVADAEAGPYFQCFEGSVFGHEIVG